jgi:hypothetical protein
MPPIAVQAALTRKQIKAAAVKARRDADRRRREEIARLAEVAAEAAAEAISPSVVRKDVIGPNGAILRGAMTERSGVSFQRANVVRNLYKRSGGIITERHVDAAEKLLSVWAEAGGGIGLGNSDYLSKSANGGGFGAGISEAKHAALLEQCQARAELEGALTFMGMLADIVGAVIFDCIDLKAWAEARGLNPRVELGRLAASLDRLCEFYEPKERPRVTRIRSVQVGEREAVS